MINLAETYDGMASLTMVYLKPSGLARTKPPPAVMPQINLLSNVSLHSPSPIVGTPFDVKANKFEYPFPDLDEQTSPSVPTNSSPQSISRPPSSGSQHLLSSSPPPHVARNISPPPINFLNYTPAHPKMRAKNREPPVPPGLITKRRRISDTMRARSPSNESVRTESDTSGDVSPMSWGSVLSSVESLMDHDPNTISLMRERKKEREVIGDGSVDLGRNVRINEAEAVDAAAVSHNLIENGGQSAGDNTPVVDGSGRDTPR